jgi:hypothetical protein
MNASKILLECCASLCEGDGVSPRHEKNKENSIVHDNRRLCRQVQKLVRLAITELGLDGWDIVSVKQKQGKTTLLLIIAPVENSSFSECELTLEWLKVHQNEIRFIVANGINRKSVPALHFGLITETDYE